MAAKSAAWKPLRLPIFPHCSIYRLHQHVNLKLTDEFCLHEQIFSLENIYINYFQTDHETRVSLTLGKGQVVNARPSLFSTKGTYIRLFLY